MRIYLIHVLLILFLVMIWLLNYSNSTIHHISSIYDSHTVILVFMNEMMQFRNTPSKPINE